PFELAGIEVRDRRGALGEDGETASRDLGEATAHIEALRLAVDVDGQDARAQRRDEGRVTGENAEITLRARHHHLLDSSREALPLGRDQFEMEGRHVRFSGWRMASGEWQAS